VLVRHGINTTIVRIFDAPNLESIFSGEEGLSLIISFVMLVVWAAYFTEGTVREAAFSYAKKLVESCETVQIQKLRKKPVAV